MIYPSPFLGPIYMNSEKKIVQVEETYPPWGHTAFLSIGQFFMKDVLEDSEVATRQ